MAKIITEPRLEIQLHWPFHIHPHVDLLYSFDENVGIKVCGIEDAEKLEEHFQIYPHLKFAHGQGTATTLFSVDEFIHISTANEDAKNRCQHCGGPNH